MKVKLYRRKGKWKRMSASCPPLLPDMNKGGDKVSEANEKLSL